MQHQLTATLLVFLLFMIACTSEKNEAGDKTNSPSALSDTSKIENDTPTLNPTTVFKVALDHLRLRAEAGEKGTEIAMLKKGTKLINQGEVSDFTTRVKLRGIWFDEPWIKVRTEQGIDGWVYAGALSFSMDQPSKLSEDLLAIRLQSFFGKGLAKDIHSYRKSYHSAKTSEDFYKVYKTGEHLRDTMVIILDNKIDVTKLDYEKLPDLFWVEEGMPGYETSLAAEGTVYYLFKDFKKMKSLAYKTDGKEDDDFIQLNLEVHAADSIEYFFEAWFLQTWDYGGHSLLGQGVHKSILKSMDSNLKKSALFLDEMIKIKDRLLSDISAKHVTYWENKEKILKELDEIIATDFSILTKEDKVALEARRKMFEDPKANGIEVYHKSGMQQ